MSRVGLAVIALALVTSWGCPNAKAPAPHAVEGPSVVVGKRAATVIYLMRHAEKAMRTPDDEDPALSAKGQRRAQALALRLEGAGISAIYITQFRRTEETAAELARLTSLTPKVVTAGLTEKLVGDMLQHHAGERVLVIGHSNTIPEIIAALGAVTPVDIDEHEYGDLFVVTRPESGAAWVVQEHVGN